ncbi:N-acetylmuramoyl-L-alanine amidase [Sphingomonas faeni]|uniref:N-acetylmuramoyl-L-alanine amidase n=1 Tax=Sphingomonas faeni TaxID=185950 RepID=UPI00278476B7|nr:N-acetylmuramoyl-L-alanine amidase [Sphingomonas faeni]MDQ0839620.1 N-acetylmuramoyl-L-alanine amidase [Sphingomonas faeni]
MGFCWTGGKSARQGRGVLTVIALIAGWLASVPAWGATVQSVAIRDGRIVIRFDEAVGDAASRVLTGPRQIAVDVTGATPGRAVTARGLVTGVTQMRSGRSGMRMVFDLAEPAIVTDGGFDSDGRELTLALRTVDYDQFAQAGIAGPLNFFPFTFGAASRPKYKVSVPVPPKARGMKLPRVQGDDTRPLVVIDAGHGGVDPGAIGPNGLREKDVTLKVAKAIRDELLASGRVRVALTRNDDRYLILRERYGVARRLKGDLFISIHCDSTGSVNATGATAYTLSEVASDKEAARLAARENKADVISGVNLGEAPADVSSILIDLTQRETMNASATFARLLGREAKPLMPLKANFHRMASLMVLKAPDMPSILFETGYISNPQDAAFLDSEEGRHRIAESVTRAVEVHFARRMAAR